MRSVALEDAPVVRFPAAGYVEIPFRRGDNHVLVEAVNGHGDANTFFLDTGASHSVVSSQYAGPSEEGSFDLEPGAAVGAAGDIPVGPRPVMVRDLRLGDLKLDRFSAIRMDVPGLYERFGAVHGILGYNVLREWLTVIDYAKARVLLMDPDHEARQSWPEPSHILPFELHLGAIIRMEGRLNLRRVAFLLDIGSPYTIFNRAAAEISGIAFLPDADFDNYENDRGERPAVGIAESLVVGNLAFVRRRVWAFEMPPFAAVGLSESPAAILGNDVLERFCVMIDYRRQEVRLWNSLSGSLGDEHADRRAADSI